MPDFLLNTLLSLSLIELVIANGVPCDLNQKYRTLNGECNNPYNPYWGSAPRTHRTVLPLEYADGTICPKVAADKVTPLPLARELSSNILFVEDKSIEPNFLSQLHVYFGMFISHDITMSFPDRKALSLYNCPLESQKCTVGRIYVGPRERYIKETQCLQLGAHGGTFCDRDGAFGKLCGCPLCKKEEFQQVNFLTSFIDLSNIYSINKTMLATHLREPGSAKMRLTEDNLVPLAPSTDDAFSLLACVQPTEPKRTGPCLLSPDREGSLIPLLQALNTLFLREHNRLVDKFKWVISDTEILFEEVRRIMIAKMQHIVYNEYLPLTLGSCINKELKVPTVNYQYNSNLDATTLKEFVAVAFRFGHTQALNFASMGTMDNQIPTGQLATLRPYYTSGLDVIDKMLLGSMRDAAREANMFYVNQTINEFWFDLNPVRGDLAATDIQRSRQYGVQSYVNYRNFFELQVPYTFDDLKNLMPPNYVEKLKYYFGEYGLKNLDLFLGGLGEYRVQNCNGILFGQTFQRIIEEQFYNLKFGDRFWYENLNKPWSFTVGQLNEIRKTTLSGMICLNTELPLVLENAFVKTSKWKNCKALVEETDLNVAHWARS